MRSAKDMFEAALSMYRRIEEMTIEEKAAIIQILRARVIAEAEERQLMLNAQRPSDEFHS